MSIRDDTQAEDFLQAYPPERSPRKKQYVILYSCCCCCCCCLHTIGGVIGAAVAGATGNDRLGEFLSGKDKPPVIDGSARSLPSSQGLYWLSMIIVLVLSLGGGVAMVFANSQGSRMVSDIGEMLMMFGILLVMFGPAFLLAASVVMAVLLAFSPRLRSKSGYWKSLGKITAGTVVGTIVGIIAMVVIGVLFAAFAGN